MRKVPEWVGKTPDSPIPPRVKDRILRRQEDRCAITGAEFTAADKIEFDHIIALANGGENREQNIQAIKSTEHCEKTREDVRTKAKIARLRKKHFGLDSKPKTQRQKHKWPSRKIPGSKGTGIRRPLNGPAYRVNE